MTHVQATPPPRGFGWRRDNPDHRDYRVLLAAPPKPLPVHVDMRAQCSPVRDQGPLGSCTGMAIAAGAVPFIEHRQHITDESEPSPLFVYYNERALEHSVTEDAGASIRDGFRALHIWGVCDEACWPYDPTQFAVRPLDACYQQARLVRNVEYRRLAQEEEQLVRSLASGFAFVFGFTVYESFQSLPVALTGEVPMPSQSEASLGGHAVLCVGYDREERRFICRNSWGAKWGQAGYFTLPFDYVLDQNLAADFWILRRVPGPTLPDWVTLSHS